MNRITREQRLEFKREMHQRYLRRVFGWWWNIDIEGGTATISTLGGDRVFKIPAKRLLQDDVIERLFGAKEEVFAERRELEKLRLGAARRRS